MGVANEGAGAPRQHRRRKAKAGDAEEMPARDRTPLQAHEFGGKFGRCDRGSSMLCHHVFPFLVDACEPRRKIGGEEVDGVRIEGKRDAFARLGRSRLRRHGRR